MDQQKSEEKVVMTMNRETAFIVERACEFYTRVLCGQYNEISNSVMDCKESKIFEEEGKDALHDNFNILIEQRDQAEKILADARHTQFPELHPNAHYGYGYSRITDLSFGAYQAIRYAFAWHDHPEGGITVNFDKPFSPYEVPKVEIID